MNIQTSYPAHLSFYIEYLLRLYIPEFETFALTVDTNTWHIVGGQNPAPYESFFAKDYNLEFDNISSVTLSPTPTEDIECHLWIDIGNGYEYQGQQDNFTPTDNVLENLTVEGKYLIFAINPTTYESGYIEFEVTN